MAMGKSRGALPNEQPASQEGPRHGEDTVAPPGEERRYQANPDFILREVAGEFIAVPTGASSHKLNGVMMLSEGGAFLWKRLSQAPQTKASLVAALRETYDVAPETALQDVSSFLEKAVGEGIVHQAQ